MRAAPLPVTLTVEAKLDLYSFTSLESLTGHIETLVLDNIYDPHNAHDKRCVPPELLHQPFFPKMELPGLKKIKVYGYHLPEKYIFECFSAICNSKLSSISLYMTHGKSIRLEKLVDHPISQNIHTLEIGNGESVNDSP